MHQIMANVAFDNAISKGILSANETNSNFAGRFMYMGSEPAPKATFSALYSIDQFKNIRTRRYISVRRLK